MFRLNPKAGSTVDEACWKFPKPPGSLGRSAAMQERTDQMRIWHPQGLHGVVMASLKQRLN